MSAEAQLQNVAVETPRTEDVGLSGTLKNDIHVQELQHESAGGKDTKGPVEGSAPWIRYRVDYRDWITREVIHQYEGRDPAELNEYEDTSSDGDIPIFESIKTIIAIRSDDKGPTSSGPPPPAKSITPTYSLRILSPAIINAVQSVVRYYPGQDLTGGTLSITWPYCILCHHYDELADFVKQCNEKEPSQLCAREKNASTHVPKLLEFLDANVMKQVREEQERNRCGTWTYEWMWVPRRPGRTALIQWRTGDEVEAVVIHSIHGDTGRYPPGKWIWKYWRLDFDGTYLGRKVEEGETKAFDGEEPFDDYDWHFVDDVEGDLDKQDELVRKMVAQGGTYWDSIKKQSRWYRGKTASFPYNELDALVQVDPGAYLAEHPSAMPTLMNSEDYRNRVSDCTCAVCQSKDKTIDKDWLSVFDDYDQITPFSHSKGLSWHQKLLCPKTVQGFVFRARTWEELHIANLSAPKFDAKMIDYLVMEPKQLKRLKALALSYSRTDVAGNKIAQPAWSADFVRGKGQGLVFLLHGKPGVGKTCTAECIAEFTRSPLMVLTSSDIGTDPKTVEINLTREFKKAKSWGAVLLIDEADIFMERRSVRDLERNSLVAGFLRALEFYDGILFLTTNRVGAFDDAFISRIHVQLYYKDFSDEERQRILQNFVDKLHRERGDTMRLNIDAKEYLNGSEVRAIKWNGREIRNAFQIAVSLAEYDAEKDQEGKTLVTDKHFRAVVELSKDFKGYLDELHKADEAKRALLRHERVES